MRKLLDALPAASGVIGASGVFLMLLVVIVTVVARYVFRNPIINMDEYATVMLIVISMIGLSYTHKQKGHINVDVITSKLPRKVALWVESIMSLFAIGILVIFLIVFSKMINRAFEAGSKSSSTSAIPLWTVQAVMFVGLVLLIIEMLVETIKLAKTTLTYKPGLERDSSKPSTFRSATDGEV